MAFTGSMSWEIVEPLDGPSAHGEFLERPDGDVHRAAFACGDMPWAERVRAFEERGLRCIRSGARMKRMPWAYVGTEETTASVPEIDDIPKASALSKF